MVRFRAGEEQRILAWWERRDTDMKWTLVGLGRRESPSHAALVAAESCLLSVMTPRITTGCVGREGCRNTLEDKQGRGGDVRVHLFFFPSWKEIHFLLEELRVRGAESTQSGG